MGSKALHPVTAARWGLLLCLCLLLSHPWDKMAGRHQRLVCLQRQQLLRLLPERLMLPVCSHQHRHACPDVHL